MDGHKKSRRYHATQSDTYGASYASTADTKVTQLAGSGKLGDDLDLPNQSRVERLLLTATSILDRVPFQKAPRYFEARDEASA